MAVAAAVVATGELYKGAYAHVTLCCCCYITYSCKQTKYSQPKTGLLFVKSKNVTPDQFLYGHNWYHSFLYLASSAETAAVDTIFFAPIFMFQKQGSLVCADQIPPSNNSLTITTFNIYPDTLKVQHKMNAMHIK